MCKQEVFEFQGLSGRKVTADFSGGYLSSDGGGSLLLRELHLKSGVIGRLAGCFADYRNPLLIEHTVEELLGQRIGAMQLGYEDLKDHDRLRHDPAVALMAGKRDVEALRRIHDRDQLLAQLRPSGIDACEGTVEALEKIIPQIRKRFGRRVEIVLRGDGGFAREAIMHWCEQNKVLYCLGLARNQRLQEQLKESFDRLECAIDRGELSTPARSFHQFGYRTLDSWCRKRRVIGKAEILEQGANPRFIVTNFTIRQFAARALYEDFYCARGDMENRIKEQQQDLFADRTSTRSIAANQLRLWFSAFAHLMMAQMQTQLLKGTRLEKATIGTIRLLLFKIAGRVKISCRRIHFELASACPHCDDFAAVWKNFQAWPS